MMRYIIAVIMFLCVMCTAAYAEVYSYIGDYSFVFALSGSTMENQLRDVNGTIITAVNSPNQVVIERTRIDGYASPGYQARITADLTVSTVINNVVFTTPAMALFDAQLSLTGVPDNVAMLMDVDPETLAVGADLPFDAPAEYTVRSLREQIAEALSISVPLGAVTQLTRVLPPGTNVVINSYQQGFIYVVQIYAPVTSPAPYPPHIFRTGNAFTLSLSEPVVEAMILRVLQGDLICRTFNTSGFPDEAGTITITGADVELHSGTMLINYYGTDKSGSERTVSWLMEFRQGRYDVDIQPVQVSVDGAPQAVPVEEEYINPVSQAFFGFARLTGQETVILAGTLGLTSITYGEIRPGAVIIAGRQW